VCIRVDALETALANISQKQETQPTLPITPGTPLALRFQDHEERLDYIDRDHQVIIDFLDKLHTQVTNNETEPTAQTGQYATLTASIAETKEKTDAIIEKVTEHIAAEKAALNSTMDRITISMTEFGELANTTEQSMTSLDPTAIHRQHVIHARATQNT